MNVKKHTIWATLLVLTLSLAFSIPIAFAGHNNANGDNGYRGTNKPSNQLPDQSNVPPPAGLLEGLFGAPSVVDGCRTRGGNVAIIEPRLGPEPVYGGPCCKGPYLYDEGGEPVYEPNQCCNPPDIIYPDPDDWTPGNHCLCFVMRFDPWPPQLPP
jgi:hypothetical protein